MTMSNTDISKMTRSCRLVKELLNTLYLEYGVINISPYNPDNTIQMFEDEFFDKFPARLIKKEFFDFETDRYFVEADGFKIFCLKDKEERE